MIWCSLVHLLCPWQMAWLSRTTGYESIKTL
jgi:hypothetical protein